MSDYHKGILRIEVVNLAREKLRAMDARCDCSSDEDKNSGKQEGHAPGCRLDECSEQAWEDAENELYDDWADAEYKDWGKFRVRVAIRETSCMTTMIETLTGKQIMYQRVNGTDPALAFMYLAGYYDAYMVAQES